MSDIQFDEFRSRVDRIERNMGKSRRYLRRDRFGVLLQRKETKPKSALVPFAKTVFKFYILFAITKAVLIYNADQEAYAQKIVQWSNGAFVEKACIQSLYICACHTDIF